MVEKHELVVEEIGCVMMGYGLYGTVKDRREYD
jgi:hypothetical protein